MRKYRLVAYLVFVVSLAVIILGSGVIMLFSPYLRFTGPEGALRGYWDAFNRQNLERASLAFSGVRLIDAPLAAQQMWRTNIQVDSIRILKKTILDENLVHLKYTVFFISSKKEKGQFITGDIISYDDWFGWRIESPCTDPPKK